MTIGIYSLYWEEQDLIYIGQSQNIERRFTEHLYKLKNNTHTNYKVQNAYNLYKLPSLYILEECSISNLNNLEIFYTKDFNSINNGLNLIEAGDVGWGSNSNSSKYTRIQILKVFSLLSKGIKYALIHKRTKVSKITIRDILKGASHLWLKDIYPQKYRLMIEGMVDVNLSAKNDATTIYARNITITNGIDIVNISSIPEFCNSIPEFKLFYRDSTQGVARVIRGTRKSYKGWKLL